MFGAGRSLIGVGRLARMAVTRSVARGLNVEDAALKREYARADKALSVLHGDDGEVPEGAEWPAAEGAEEMMVGGDINVTISNEPLPATQAPQSIASPVGKSLVGKLAPLALGAALGPLGLAGGMILQELLDRPDTMPAAPAPAPAAPAPELRDTDTDTTGVLMKDE